MRRPYKVAKFEELVERMREVCPSIAISTDIIVGFPGETEADFEKLLEFLREAKLDRVGCFQYSPVDGAKSNELPMHVDDEIKEERWNRFMKVQQQISTEKLAEKVGSTIEIIIDEANEEVIIGRSAADAPEIDGLVYVETKEEIELGEIISAKVVKSDEYDLFASF